MVACSAPPQAQAPAGPDDIDPRLLEPLRALGPCDQLPTELAPPEEVPGLVLPDGSLITSIEQREPLTEVQGYMPMTPIQMRVHYERLDGYEVFLTEDEQIEAEVLIGDGEHRLFVKAQGVCELGSLFVAIVAPESAATVVPTPSGRPSPAATSAAGSSPGPR